MVIPNFVMMVGLPGSGKSYYADSVYDTYNIHSSDRIREELFGFRDQDHNNEVFAELHKRVKQDLRDGKNVVYDATNINKKKRIAFLQELKNIPCKKVCAVMTVPYELCQARNIKREHPVPDKVIEKMFKNFQPPHSSEGWDKIYYTLNYNVEKYKKLNEACSKTSILTQMNSFNQYNKHHTLFLASHCLHTHARLEKYYHLTPSDPSELEIAACFHDAGKLYTRSFFNKKGEYDDNAHYYQHHCVGAYIMMVALALEGYYNYSGSETNYYTHDQITEIINYIYYHMHPLTAWKQSEKAMERDRELLGEEFFNNVLLLSEADQAAR